MIGFGAVNADAAEVLSVTIDAPADSGTVLGIDGVFTVTAVVEDFSSTSGGDGVIMALVSGTGTEGALEVVGDGVTGGGKGTVAQVVSHPDLSRLNTGLVDRSGAADGQYRRHGPHHGRNPPGAQQHGLGPLYRRRRNVRQGRPEAG